VIDTKAGGEREMKRSFKRNMKGVSPVIATIIIVAIAIVMSIAVAYWMLGLGGAFTRYEKLEFQSAYCVVNGANFDINVRLKNTGSADATVDLVFLNAKPADAVAFPAPSTPTIAWQGGVTNPTLAPGDEITGTISLLKSTALTETAWKSGMGVELMIQTVAGKQYPKVIILP